MEKLKRVTLIEIGSRGGWTCGWIRVYCIEGMGRDNKEMTWEGERCGTEEGR